MQFVGGFLGDVMGILFWIIDLYIYIIVAAVIVSWLFAFNILNRHQPIVNQIAGIIYALTEPALRPIRRLLPNLGGIDFSPLVLIFGLILLKSLIRNIFFALFA